MKEIKYDIALLIIFIQLIFIWIDIWEIRDKVKEIDEHNIEVHEYILNRIGA